MKDMSREAAFVLLALWLSPPALLALPALGTLAWLTLNPPAMLISARSSQMVANLSLPLVANNCPNSGWAQEMLVKTASFVSGRDGWILRWRSSIRNFHRSPRFWQCGPQNRWRCDACSDQRLCCKCSPDERIGESGSWLSGLVNSFEFRFEIMNSSSI